MKKLFPAIFIAAILTSCISEGGDRDIENYVKVGDAVPSFTVTHADGNATLDFTSSDFVGYRSVIVLFWSPCDDCKREMPKVHTAWKHFFISSATPDVRFVLISRGEPVKTVADYWVSVTDTKPSFSPMPYYLDPDKSAFEVFANGSVPRIYLVGSDGKVKYMAIERFGFDADGLIEMINNLN